MKRVIVYLANGFEEVEALTVVDYLRRVDIHVDMVSIHEEKMVEGSHNITVTADKVLSEIKDVTEYDGIVFPGGMPGATNLRDNSRVIEHVQLMNQKKKVIGAICAAPIVLGQANIIENRKITSYPGFQEALKGSDYQEKVVCVDEHIVTSRGPATAVVFALKLIEVLIGKEESQKLADSILLSMLVKEF